MAFSPFDFEPGLFSDDSEALSEMRYVDGSNVRFRRKRPQIIGGWELLSASTFLAPIRGAHAFAAFSGDRTLMFGSAKELKAYFGGRYIDITPDKARGTLTDPFTTTSGSKTVKVRDLDHGLKTGDVVTFAHAQGVGGVTLNGAFPVTVVTFDDYTVEAATNATSAATGGGYVDFSVPLEDGLIDGVGGTGYGTGGYGLGAYGLPTGGDIDPAVWSTQNWGNKGLALRNNGPLFEYQPLASYDEVLKNGSFDNGFTDWTAGPGWNAGTGQANATAGSESPMTQDVTGRLRGGVVYVMEIDILATAGSVRLQGESADLDEDDQPIVESLGEPMAVTGVYRRRFYGTQSPTKIHLQKNATFVGAIRSVSIKPEAEAYRIPGAPQHSRCMFVDPNRFVVLCGTVTSNGDYDPMVVRWSDQGRNMVWLKDDDNLAGESAPLGAGSRIIGAIPTRGQNLIFTDTALFTMRFNGAGFTFDPVSNSDMGLLGRNAVVEVNGGAIFLGRNRQPYIFRGGEPQIIECPIIEEFARNLAFSQAEKVFAGINSAKSEVWFFYPDKRDGTNECSRYIAFNWAENTWFKGEMKRSAWIAAGVYENPVAFDPERLQAFFQERGVTANGDVIPWRLKSGRFNLGEGDTFFAMKRMRPDFSNQVGNIRITIDAFADARGPQFTRSTTEITPQTPDFPLRQQGRVMQITYEPGTNCRSATWGAPSVDIQALGARR